MAAGSDPLDIVNNLSDFIFSIIRALGVQQSAIFPVFTSDMKRSPVRPSR